MESNEDIPISEKKYKQGPRKKKHCVDLSILSGFVSHIFLV
jgi:hypothetical protein